MTKYHRDYLLKKKKGSTSTSDNKQQTFSSMCVLDATESMSADNHTTFACALPVLHHIKIHLSKDDIFKTVCPDENV